MSIGHNENNAGGEWRTISIVLNTVSKGINESRPFVKCVLQRERDTLHDGDMHKDWVKYIAQHIAYNEQKFQYICLGIHPINGLD